MGGDTEGKPDSRARFPERQGQNQDRTRVNERIRVPEVRVIDENGEQLGVLPTREAMARARERGLDLVEVAPDARPPVCKILDYGKLKYLKKKKEQEAKKKSVTIDVKEVQLRPNIEEHDLLVKYRKMVDFLSRGDKVKIVLMFRGREMAYAKKQGTELLDRILDMLKDVAVSEAHPKLEGRRMIMVLAPGKATKSASPAKKPSESEGPSTGTKTTKV